MLNSAMENKVTSKTSSLKALLLRAWRERWSDFQWGINIKTILPRGVSGDVHNLTDCILQQAFVGSGPNELILSYLTHSLCSQVVSYAAVLQRISKYNSFHKPHCIARLLEFLESICTHITCRGKAEEDLLATSCLSIVYWILQCYHYSLTKPPHDNPITLQPAELMVKSALVLKQLLASDFIYAMVYSAKYENKDLYANVVKTCHEIEQQKVNVKCLIPIEDSLKKLCNLEIKNFVSSVTVEIEPVTYCLQPLIAINNLVNPCTEISVYVSQLQMIQRLKNYPNARLYCELIRSCMMCLYDVTGTIKEPHWGSFIVLKLPQILKEFHASSLKGVNEKMDHTQDVLEAFELLQNHVPLLDKLDIVFAGNSIEFLITELQKVSLVTESQAKETSSKREKVILSSPKLSLPNSSSIRSVIMRAGPTLAGVLKTLNAEYSKIQEALLSMLCQILAGNSFELILSVATVEGKLKTFVSRLIKCNESSRKMSEANGKGGRSSALLFEISFLMLCSIVQTYGLDIVLDTNGNSFFEQWVRHFMPLEGKLKSPQKMLEKVNPIKVDMLLNQLVLADHLTKSSTKWHLACQTAMGVAKELLYAWECNVLNAADLKKALNRLRSFSCCLPVCAAAWLCAYMSITHQDALLKPINMVQQFLTPLASDEIQDHFRERSNLMFKIIRKMQHQTHPLTNPKANSIIISKIPLIESLKEIWKTFHQHRWINMQMTQTFESLLKTGGPLWFVSNLVEELFKMNCQEELDRSVDFIFATLHLDIENCTVGLINHVVPQYLLNCAQEQKLMEPQSSALAKLCVCCVLSTLEYYNYTQQGNNKKRARKETDLNEMDSAIPAAKMFKLDETSGCNSMFSANSTYTQGTTNEQKSIVLREPLLGALNRLFSTFNFLTARSDDISQHIHFIFRFLQLTVQCGKDQAVAVLQTMPQTLVPSLLKTIPELFTVDIILQLYDAQTKIGRKAIARDLCMLRNVQLKSLKSST